MSRIKGGHNHNPMFCTCPWCVSIRKKYINSSEEKFNYSNSVLDAFPIAKFSFTNPNAICPVCGSKVFFYQNTYGSRVFFDELGPPWPKHPCTDNSQLSSNYKYRNNDVYDLKKNLIPVKSKSTRKSKSITQSKQDWRKINYKDLTERFEHIYGNIYEFKKLQYFSKISLKKLRYNSFYFINDKNIDHIRISSYDVDFDEIINFDILSKSYCFENNLEESFKVEENDIFFVEFISDNTINYTFRTINRFPREFKMTISNFLPETRKKILFNKCKGLKKIKVIYQKTKIYEIE